MTAMISMLCSNDAALAMSMQGGTPFDEISVMPYAICGLLSVTVRRVLGDGQSIWWHMLVAPYGIPAVEVADAESPRLSYRMSGALLSRVDIAMPHDAASRLRGVLSAMSSGVPAADACAAAGYAGEPVRLTRRA